MRRAASTLAMAFLAAALACGRPTQAPVDPVDPGPGMVRLPTPPGATLSPPVTTTVGTAGGSAISTDGGLTISVPAGALASPTAVTITPIANTARGGIGPAYRLGPEDRTFSTPVTLTFKAPQSYPAGTSIAGIGIEYQDRRGYWHRIEPVTRDAAAGTLSVTTDHFSDWAMTWQTGVAAAEGPIHLAQTVDVPFDAYGRATIFYQGDNATETVYLLTGTLTVPETISYRGETCVPDQQTKTLSLNLAELTKGDPAVFRWGVGTHWSLSCTAPGGGITTRLMPALFDTMYINLTRCGGYYEAGQIAQPDHIAGTYTKNCGIEGYVSGTWDLRSCVDGLACDAGGVCRAGETVCAAGVATCVDVGPAPNGTSCGPGDRLVCSEAQCVDLDDQEVGFTVTPTAGLTTRESGGSATFQIVLNKVPTANVTVALSTDSGEGTVTPASVTFTPADWSTPQVVTVEGRDDLVDDGDVVYHVVTAPAQSVDPRYGGRDPYDVEVTNVDNDVAGFTIDPQSGLVTTEGGGTATFRIALSSQPIADVTIDVTANDPTEGDPSPASLVFTASDWNVPREVTVAGVDDAVADGAVEYSVLVNGVSADPNYGGRSASIAASNADDDSAGLTVSPTAGLSTSETGTMASFTVVLGSEPTAEVRVPVASGDPTEGSVDVTELVFTPADWDVVRTVTVTGVDDAVADGTVPYTVSVGPPATTDATYAALPATLVALTSADDDVASVFVDAPSDTTTSEAGDFETFTVVLTSQPTADVTVPVSSGDATEGAVSPAPLTFTPETWDVPQTVTVTGVEDAVDDGDQPFAVVIGPAASADPGYDGIDPADLGFTNLDDDVAGLLVSPTAGLETSESQSTTPATFTVVLGSEPTGEVRVPIASSDAGEGTASVAELVFTPADWNVVRTVTVTGADDAVADGTVEYTITAGPPVSADTGYATLAAKTVAVTNTDDDVPGITVSPPSGLSTSEAGAAVTFTVVLDSEPTADVTVPVSSTDTTEGTVSPGTLTFTAANWNVPQIVTVSGVGDFADDGDQAFDVSIGPSGSADPNYQGNDPADLTFTNVDDDGAGLAISPVAGLVTTEAGGIATFTVALTSEPTADVSLAISSSDTTEGTADVAELVFTPGDWNVARTVTVTGVNDDVADGPASYTITVGPPATSDVVYAALPASTVSVTNSDGDVAGIAVGSPSDFATSEAETQVTFTIVLGSEPTAPVSIPVSSGDPGEATVSPEVVTFTSANWSVPQIVTVTGVDDLVDDGDRLFDVTIGPSTSADPSYDGLDPADLLLTNVDDDAAGVTLSPAAGLVTSEAGGAAGTAIFTVVLDSEPTAEVRIPISSTDPTEGTADVSELVFTDATWNVPRLVTVIGVDDDVADGPVAYGIAIGPPVGDPVYAALPGAVVGVTNTNDDVASVVVSAPSGSITSEAATSVTFTVVLTSEPLADVTVPVASGDATEGTASPAVLTFTAASWNEAQTVTVTGVADDVDDGDQLFTVLVGPSGSADPAYQGFDPADPSFTNTDDDAAGITVSAPSGTTTTEAGASVTFTVALQSEPTADVTVPVSSADTTEGTVSPAFLTFTAANWNAARTVTVTGAADALDDGDQPFDVIVGPASSADPSYEGLDPADLALTNLDDDDAALLVSPTEGLETSEAGGTAFFTVALATEPTAEVRVPVSSTDSTEGTPDVAELVFTPADWSAVRTVTVTGVGDSLADGSVAYAITVGPPTSTDAAYAALPAATVAVTNTDDDEPDIVVSPPSGFATSEAGTFVTFTVALATEPTSDVTVEIASTETGEATVSPAPLTFTPESWNVPQTVTVTGVDDFVDDGDQPFAVLIGPSSSSDPSYQDLDPADLIFTNQDDDGAGLAISPSSGLATSEAGTKASFTVALTSQPTAEVRVPVASGDLGEGTTDVAELVFTTADWNVARTVTVTGVNDSVVDGAVGYVVTVGPPSTEDAIYAAVPASTVSVTNTDDDAAGITVSPTAGLVTSEAGDVATFTVVLTSEPAAEVRVPVSSTDATEGTTDVAELVFTAADWSVARTVTVTGVDDDDADGPVAYAIAVGPPTSGDPAYAALSAASVGVTNVNDDVASVSVSAPTGTVTSEAGTFVTFTVVLTSRPGADVTVPISSDDATEGTTDVTELVFTAADWSVARTVTVTGVDDALDDGVQPFAALVGPSGSADPAYQGIDPADPSFTNTDDDAAGITVSAPSGTTTSESGESVTFTVVLQSEPTADVTVPVSSTDTTEGTVSPAFLTFTGANWSAAQTVTVTGVSDALDDGDFPFGVAVGPASSADPSYQGFDPPDLALTNLDDDDAGLIVSPTAGLVTSESGGTAIFTVALATEPTAEVRIPVSSTDVTEGTPDVAELVFTSADWNVVRTVTVTGASDAIADGSVAYAITVGPPASTDAAYAALPAATVAVTNTDDDVPGVVVSAPSEFGTSEAGAFATFTVVLETEPTSDVTISISSDDPTEGAVSPGPLTFTPENWNVAQTVTVTGVGDFVDDGDQPFGVVIGPSSSADPSYEGIDPADLIFTNQDDDGAGLAISPSSGLVTSEAQTEASFTVALTSEPTAEVRVPVSSGDPSEGTLDVAELVFTTADWNVARTVTVTGVNDFVADGSVGYVVTVGPPSSTDAVYAAVPPATVSVTNGDDDVPGIEVSPPSGLTTSETPSSPPVTFTVVLGSEPTADVTIPIEISPPPEGFPPEASVSPVLLTFTAADWDQPQTVTVTGLDDLLVDGDQPFSVLIGRAASLDPGYAEIDPADPALTNTDDDVPQG